MNDLGMVINPKYNAGAFNQTQKGNNNYYNCVRRNSKFEPNCTYNNYTSFEKGIGRCHYIYTDENGFIKKIVEKDAEFNPKKMTIQELKNADGVQLKTTEVIPMERRAEAYKSIQKLDRETGLYSVVRKKGDKIIGGYEVNLSQADRKFARGFKGKLEKLALNIATDANGCERKGLRKIGDLLFKISKRIR